MEVWTQWYWDWYSYHMVTCRDSKEAKSSWAPKGMLVWASLPVLKSGELDTFVHPWMGKPRKCQQSSPWHPGTSSLWLCSLLWLWGSWLTRGGYTDQFFQPQVSVQWGPFCRCQSHGVLPHYMSNMLRSSRSPFSCRVLRQLQSSCTALQSIPGGIPEWTADLWIGPWPVPPILHATPLKNLEFPGTHLRRMIVLLHSSAHLDRAVVDHQPSFSSCAAGTLKATACQQTNPLTLMSLKCSSLEWRRDQNSLHHSGTLSFFCR